MAAMINVPASFIDDWRYFCKCAGLDSVEQNQLRQQVREDFDRVGAHIVETAAVYRFCNEKWGGLPTSYRARAFCGARHWWPADDGLFDRLGPLLLGKLCAQVAGVVPWPTVVE